MMDDKFRTLWLIQVLHKMSSGLSVSSTGALFRWICMSCSFAVDMMPHSYLQVLAPGFPLHFPTQQTPLVDSRSSPRSGPEQTGGGVVVVLTGDIVADGALVGGGSVVVTGSVGAVTGESVGGGLVGVTTG
jgi:hypothetical protein